MNTKLTLSIDPKLIEHAKNYAEEKKRSLSRIVSDYFRSLHQEEVTGHDPFFVDLHRKLKKRKKRLTVPHEKTLIDEHIRRKYL